MTSSLSLLVSVLLQMGFALILYVSIKAVSSYLAFSSLPHKISLKAKLWRSTMWRLFSVALSLRFPSLDVIQHHCSVEPGLSSYATFRLCSTRPFNLLFFYFTLIMAKSQLFVFSNINIFYQFHLLNLYIL